MAKAEERKLIEQDRAYWQQKKRESRARQRGKPCPSAEPFTRVVLSVSAPGQTVVGCALDDPRATVVYVNSKGERLSAMRPIETLYAVEVRSLVEMTGACRKLLHSETWKQPLGEAMRIPDNALFIARVFESPH